MECPKLGCKFNVLTRPDGSVLFCEGDTTVIAGVYGPVEAKLQKILIDRASVECLYRPKSGLPGVKDRFRETIIRNICETSLVASLYPRAAILVNLQEMHDNGNLISCAINSSCIACLHAGIDMKFMFAAVTCFVNSQNEISFMDPIVNSDIKATLVFVFDSIHFNIIASHVHGCFSKELYEEALDLSRDQSKNIFNFFKQSLLPVID